MEQMEKAALILDDMCIEEVPRGEIWSHKDDSPYQELYRQCHGDMLPDDHRYEMIHDVLTILADTGDEGDIMDRMDQAIPVYTHDLLTWLSSRDDRVFYVDDAIAEYGPFDQIATAISAGYRREMQEVYDLAVSWMETEME